MHEHNEGEKKIRAICPDDPTHRRFKTLVLEEHEWLVDEQSEMVRHLGLFDVEIGPDWERLWVCAECGAEAEMEVDIDDDGTGLHGEEARDETNESDFQSKLEI